LTALEMKQCDKVALGGSAVRPLDSWLRESCHITASTC